MIDNINRILVYVQGGKNSLPVAVIDEFCPLDLIKITCYNRLIFILNFNVKNFYSFLYSSYHEDKTFLDRFACVLTATLWFRTRGCLYYVLGFTNV